MTLFSPFSALFACSHCKCSFFLTSIRVLMVSAFKLAWWREIVSWPPEKTLSTATAEAGENSELLIKSKQKKNSPGMDKTSHASQYRLGKEAQQPNHHWIGLQVSKSSWGSFQNSRSLSISTQGFRNWAVKFFCKEQLRGKVVWL